MIAKPNQPKHLHWCIVLAALTCVSASPSIVDPETIFAGSSASKHPLGVVGQSDARVKRYLTTTLTTTESMDDNNEDRGINVASVIDQGLAARVTESVETGLRETAVIPGEAPNNSVIAEKVEESVETAVTPGVAAKDPVIAEKIEESDKGGVIPGVAARDHDPAAKVGKSVEKTVDSRTREPPNVPVDSDQLFKKVMGDQIAFYRNGENLFKSDKYAKWSKSVNKAYKTASSAPLEAEVAKASTLLAIYDKDVVLSMLAAGRKDPSTQKIAKNLEIGLVRKWSSDHNVDNIMDLLTVGKDKSEVLMGTSLKLWFDIFKNDEDEPIRAVCHAFYEALQ
ncbi:unnamed protein product [Peronospora destructor]|uniref:RxLR effector protein n=1 Tax=Peronospora destructor TaxID=86335 RepID=A0AAV0TZV7_9STRA|nr:unnamed protein product [Peronospora destructor]